MIWSHESVLYLQDSFGVKRKSFIPWSFCIANLFFQKKKIYKSYRVLMFQIFYHKNIILLLFITNVRKLFRNLIVCLFKSNFCFGEYFGTACPFSVGSTDTQFWSLEIKSIHFIYSIFQDAFKPHKWNRQACIRNRGTDKFDYMCFDLEENIF